MKISFFVKEKQVELNHYTFCLVIACRALGGCVLVGQSIYSGATQAG